MDNEKRYIPHTNSDWGVELPDEDDNSLVDKYGRNHDDGFNFDEKRDEEEEEEEKERAINRERGEETLNNTLDKE